VHHVHMEAGGRVSYKPYRDVSKVLISRLRQFAGVGVIEKASIDEAYILFKLEPGQQGQQVHGAMAAMQQAAQLAGTIRQAGGTSITCARRFHASSQYSEAHVCILELAPRLASHPFASPWHVPWQYCANSILTRLMVTLFKSNQSHALSKHMHALLQCCKS